MFALHIGCPIIHLVGCDCTDHEKVIPDPTAGSYHKHINGWKYMQAHVRDNHPDRKIISINPVALKEISWDS
jgi:hypothetical protein